MISSLVPALISAFKARRELALENVAVLRKKSIQRYAIFFFADHNPVVSKNTNDLKTGAPDRKWI